VRVFTRNGNDFTRRFPLAVAAVAALPARSCLLDGEAIVCDEGGLAVFNLIRQVRHGAEAVLCAFDLLELNGNDLRRAPIEHRKRHSPRSFVFRNQASYSAIITSVMEMSYLNTRASLAVRALCRSGSVRHIDPVAPRTG
jgi:hypothetical protein